MLNRNKKDKVIYLVPDTSLVFAPQVRNLFQPYLYLSCRRKSSSMHPMIQSLPYILVFTKVENFCQINRGVGYPPETDHPAPKRKRPQTRWGGLETEKTLGVFQVFPSDRIVLCNAQQLSIHRTGGVVRYLSKYLIDSSEGLLVRQLSNYLTDRTFGSSRIFRLA